MAQINVASECPKCLSDALQQAEQALHHRHAPGQSCESCQSHARGLLKKLHSKCKYGCPGGVVFLDKDRAPDCASCPNGDACVAIAQDTGEEVKQGLRYVVLQGDALSDAQQAFRQGKTREFESSLLD